MDRETTRRIESYRRNEAGPLENNLIDEFMGGEMDRSEFLRRGTMFGLSVGMMGSLLAFAGEAAAAPSSSGASTTARAGGTLRLGIAAFGASLEPYLLNEGGSLAFAGIPGEFLTFTTRRGRSYRRSRPAGSRTRMPPCGRSRSERASSSTTAPR